MHVLRPLPQPRSQRPRGGLSAVLSSKAVGDLMATSCSRDKHTATRLSRVNDCHRQVLSWVEGNTGVAALGFEPSLPLPGSLSLIPGFCLFPHLQKRDSFWGVGSAE